MKTGTLVLQPVKVKSAVDGREVDGKLIRCPDCDSETWVMFTIEDHLHFQCAVCETSFCTGECK